MYQRCRGACAAHKGHARKRDTSPALGQAQHQQGKGGFFTSSAHPQTPHSTQGTAAPPQEPRSPQFPSWDAVCTPVLPAPGLACSTAQHSHALS